MMELKLLIILSASLIFMKSFKKILHIFITSPFKVCFWFKSAFFQFLNELIHPRNFDVVILFILGKFLGIYVLLSPLDPFYSLTRFGLTRLWLSDLFRKWGLQGQSKIELRSTLTVSIVQRLLLLIYYDSLLVILTQSNFSMTLISTFGNRRG